MPTPLAMPELTPWHMFTSADIIVKVVMVLLALASVVTWTILLGKALELRSAQVRLRAQVRAAAGSATLDDLPDRSAPMAVAAAEEIRLSEDLPVDGTKERIAQRLNRIEAALVRRMTRGTGVLATVGAVAPFVGLFGTVWGIMNSFVGIARMQTTNLAVVAPGIAEALLATAAGLVAAIPAVVIYNVFARAAAGHKALVGDLAASIWGLASRDLDRAAAARHPSRLRPLVLHSAAAE